MVELEVSWRKKLKPLTYADDTDDPPQIFLETPLISYVWCLFSLFILFFVV